MLVQPCAFSRARQRDCTCDYGSDDACIRACLHTCMSSPLPTFVDLHFLSCAHVLGWGLWPYMYMFKLWMRWIISNTSEINAFSQVQGKFRSLSLSPSFSLSFSPRAFLYACRAYLNVWECAMYVAGTLVHMLPCVRLNMCALLYAHASENVYLCRDTTIRL